MNIKKVAVLGSGVMGAGIAAHLANAGIPSYLLDIVPPELTDDDKKAGLAKDSKAFRNKFALNAINNILPKQKPSPIFDNRVFKLITPGNFEDDFSKIGECDWVIEVVVEKLAIKKKVFDQVEKHMKKGAVISSNTSGIKLADMIEGRSPEFAKNFLNTHFFNPVRYMKLVEIISGAKTNPEVVSFMADFLENKLGKGVVYAKDTPSFIANRIGVYGFMATLQHALQTGISVEAVDKITGPATGKAKSATFRTGDLAGLDTLAHVAKNNYEQLPDDEARDMLKFPPILDTLLNNKWLGDKTGQGFYKKSKDASGNRVILSIDLKTGEYKEQEKVRYDCLGLAKNIEDVGEKIKAVVNATDNAGQFAWLTTRDALIYAANRVPEIADDIVNVDNAMKWGFGWELGPFEVLDALGVSAFADRAKKDGKAIPPLIDACLKNGDGVFYKSGKGEVLYFDLTTKKYQPVKTRPTSLVIKRLKEQNRVLKSNAGASIVDLGDGVVNVEFHS
ncbi:MAG: 3-hydroxyacyl-CoA dehydrogenase, partial [Deltaproteobacteria bacterium]|nr:3-hydroxyacyl-CoA dehydrogenase [Deltaproteobacteria bacterium]